MKIRKVSSATVTPDNPETRSIELGCGYYGEVVDPRADFFSILIMALQKGGQMATVGIAHPVARTISVEHQPEEKCSLFLARKTSCIDLK
jgi:hypothetical protein